MSEYYENDKLDRSKVIRYRIGDMEYQGRYKFGHMHSGWKTRDNQGRIICEYHWHFGVLEGEFIEYGY